MALDRFGAEVFLLLRQHGICLQRVLTFGRQHFAVQPQETASIAGLAEIVQEVPELTIPGEKFADPFFRAIGADTVDSLDASGYESCSLIHDLNDPIPDDWHENYDVVFDGGTLEHVFHFPNAIANAMNLVKPGGCFVSCSPSNNYNGHGFYQFSPELFFRLFNQANGFRVLLLALAESDRPYRKYQVEDPDSIGCRVTFGGQCPLQLIMIAKRERNEEILTIPPFQSDYSAVWKESAIPAKSPPDNATWSPVKSIKRFFRRMLPNCWIRRYEEARYKQRRWTLSRSGIRKIQSLNSCFRNGDMDNATSNHMDVGGVKSSR